MTSALFPVISFRYFSLLLLGALLSVLMEVLNSSFRNDKIRMSKHVSLCRRFSGILLSLHFTYGMQMQSYFTNTKRKYNEALMSWGQSCTSRRCGHKGNFNGITFPLDFPVEIRIRDGFVDVLTFHGFAFVRRACV